MVLPRRFFCTVLLLPLLSTIASSYQWPSPQYDALEELLYEGLEKSGLPIASLASFCSERLSIEGSTPTSIAAEWLRLAYHDMATHNISDSTGGLDASIYYEYERAENIGAGIIDSLNDFAGSPNKYVSRADVIAMGAIWGVTGCGGPPITFRGGRIDSLEAGRPGVPEPQQDLKTHTESFRLQGFTPTEMISLVACGHTIGSVRKLDFPEIVSKSDLATFDSTKSFDTAIVSEYLSGKTQNPLVVVANSTLQSDRRIFASDGNVTIKSMQAPAEFNKTCSTLFARMLDTVPANVKLTDEITFLPFKVKSARVTIADSKLIFNVDVRVQTRDGNGNGFGERFNVTMLWCDARGENADCSDGQVNFAVLFADPIFPSSSTTRSDTSPLTDALGITSRNFRFTVPLSKGSVRKFWFEIGDMEKNTVNVEDNGGPGYIIEQDTLIALSSDLESANTNAGVTAVTATVNAGVLSENKPTLSQVRAYDNSLSIRLSSSKSPPTIPLPVNITVDLKPNSSLSPVAGYTFYTAKLPILSVAATLDYTIELNGTRYELDFLWSISASNFKHFRDTLITAKKRALPASNNSTDSTGSPPASAALGGSYHIPRLTVIFSGSILSMCTFIVNSFLV